MRVLLFGCKGLLGQNLVLTAPAEVEIVGADLGPAPASPSPSQENGIPAGGPTGHLPPGPRKAKKPDAPSPRGGLTSYTPADIAHRDSLLETIADQSPDWIFNAAAMTAVDQCETDVEICGRVNRDAVGQMASAGLPMVHLSTDYVFDGEAGPYREADPVHPLSVYGRCKLESERPVLEGHGQSIVVRTMLLWGRESGNKPSFVEWVRRKLAAGESIRVVDDQVGNPTLAADLARAIWLLVNLGCLGVYHVSGRERLSRLDWARKVADFYRLDPRLIVPAKTGELDQLARRPLQSGFVLDKLVRDTGFLPGDVWDQLRRAHNHERGAELRDD